MPKQNVQLVAFNRGIISPLALARVDIDQILLSADQQKNFMPRVLGSMMLRPGLGFVVPIIAEFSNTTLTVDVGGNKTLSSSTGLANDSTSYTATLSWNTIDINIAVTGSAAQTYATLLDAIYDDILSGFFGGEDITVFLSGGNIVFQIEIAGNSSSLTLTDTGSDNLFSSLTGFSSIGSASLGETGIDSDSKLIPFIYAKDDTANIAFVDSEARVIVDDEYVDPPSVSSDITNGHFLYTLDNWTDNDDAGCTSSHVAGDDNMGYMSLVGTGFNYARRHQQIIVSAGDQGDRHQVRFVIARGVVDINIGTSAGDGSYYSASVGAGVHWASFSPTGSFYIELSSATKYASLVDSVWFSNSGLIIDTQYAETEFSLMRHAQSGDVVYLACEDKKPQKIERRGTYSWGIADYLPPDGPFLPYNETGITLTPSDTSGDITLTASQSFFKSGHVGALFLIDSVGQEVEIAASGANQFTNEIRVTGITRSFLVTVASVGSNTVTLQRSIGAPGSWVDVTTYTSNGTTAFNDSLDNQIIYYRIGIKTGDYSSGTTTVTLEYSQGSISGICRVVKRNSATSADAIVLREFGGTEATVNWREGAWSGVMGYPSATALFEGRLWWAGKGNIWGSASDAYETFDPDLEGDVRPISRSIGFGVSDAINWMVGGQRLLLGTDSRVLSARSSREDLPLTQDNFGLKSCSTQGSAKISPITIDSDVMYVHSSKTKLIHLYYDGGVVDYRPASLMTVSPEIGEPSITHIEVQFQPDTRIHCVRSDGTAAVRIFDPVEEVHCWVEVETEGDIEDVVVLPGDTEDRVYYIVKRSIPDAPFATDANVVRYIEKFALESECEGGTLNKQADAFITYSGPSTTTLNSGNLSQLQYLEDQEVVVWGDGKYNGTYTVSGNSLTLGIAVSEAIIGLPYTGVYESAKLAFAAGLGSALTQRKRIHQLGLVLRNTHALGIKYGPDADNLDEIPKADLPEVGGAPDEDHVFTDYDLDMFSFNDTWNTDSRLYLQSQAPFPCTVLAAVIGMQTNDKG